MKAKVLREWLENIPDQAIIQVHGDDGGSCPVWVDLDQENMQAVVEGPCQETPGTIKT